MPYDPDSPPAKTSKLSANKRKQWVEVFNSCWEKHGDEGKCHAMAWGVANKDMPPELMKDYLECCVGDVSPAVLNLLKFSEAAGALGKAAKGAGVGEIRTWGKRKYVKTPKGWRPVAAGKTVQYGKPRWEAKPARGLSAMPAPHQKALAAAGLHEDSTEVEELHGFKKTLGPRGRGRSVPQLKMDFVAHMNAANYKNYKEFQRAKERIQRMPVQVFGALLAALRDEEEGAPGGSGVAWAKG